MIILTSASPYCCFFLWKRAEHQRVLKCKGFANPSVSDVYWQLTAVQIHAQAGQSTAAVLGTYSVFKIIVIIMVIS